MFTLANNSIINTYTHSTAIADTGSTGHYITTSTPQTIVPASDVSTLPSVTLPDNTYITASHAATIPLSSHLTKEATLAYTFPKIAKPLVSIGQICDDNCTTIFTKEKCYVLKNTHINISQFSNKSFLTGERDKTTKLWTFNLQNSIPNAKANTVYEMKLKELIHFQHKALFSPTKQTWLQAIKNGFFSTWHGVNFKNVNKHLTLTTATAKGHMRQQPQHYRSTKILHNDIRSIDMTATSKARTNVIYIKQVSLTGLLCTDQTGAFPVTSNKGNRYMMVAHHFDTNAILVRPLPSRSQLHLNKAFTSIYDALEEAGHTPTSIRLDNESSTSLKKLFKKKQLTFQLVPPNNHRRNYAEKAIAKIEEEEAKELKLCDKIEDIK